MSTASRISAPVAPPVQSSHFRVVKPTPSIRVVQQQLSQISGYLWTKEEDNVITAPYGHLTHSPGKDIRRVILSAFNVWFGVSSERFEIINTVVAILHNASLLIDDIEDSSPLRRGKPSAHEVYGIPQTLNCGNYMYFRALQELSKLGAGEEAVSIYTEELLCLHRGQGMDLFWRDTGTVPKTEEYLRMVANKTGGLFRLAVKLLRLCSPIRADTRDLDTLASLLGILFQIRDDYLNLHASEYADAKGFAEDLTEGKFSFLILHAVNMDPGSMLLGILKQRPTEFAIKKRAVDYLERVGSFAYTREVLAQIEELIMGIMNQRGGNEVLTCLVQRMRVA
ncbi:geranylgeranyl pyrophosphate synthase [Trichophaea hybrida]|nr:geranylgeranyl pyrophosphate synthase [Trichophaea hybrida]